MSALQKENCSEIIKKVIYKKAVIKVPKNKVKSYTKLMKNKGQAKNVKIKK
ncbi:hypothetical protein SAMN05216249_1209 [Acetitomaculum ruminis DSM 5522]|uniref:Uncharacterized protein n=1 Tax=Acetitomaculum ruminis DSM 5522 TaxID=1120918 RepID=A0A1I1A5N5_9FIRM|nr:hypothetical protein [Acetitomaculum ruminis]SFB31800.1 hypothetical protein SAMN05216249_1209 [Acetitomaculum ruminis DSM 5522]